MRLHSLQISAFGPFAEHETIDFDALARSGLYLIHGPTGAGKTSILDAVCFALYAAVPGARAGSRRSLRSDHAVAGAVPRVTLELSVQGRRFRVARSPEFERPKKRGAGMTPVAASVTLEERVAGRWEVKATRPDEAAQVIQDVIGMGLEQFNKVVLLPQGDFAAFLRASPEERREVLERLFDTQRFTDVEGWLATQRRDAAAALEQARSALRTGLMRLDDVLAGLPITLEDGYEWPDWDEVGVAEVSAAVADVQQHVTTLAGTALAEADQAQGAQEVAASAREEARRVVVHQQTATTATCSLAALADQRDSYDEAVRQVGLAERARAVSGHLESLDQARADTAAAVGAVQAARTALEELCPLDGGTAAPWPLERGVDGPGIPGGAIEGLCLPDSGTGAFCLPEGDVERVEEMLELVRRQTARLSEVSAASAQASAALAQERRLRAEAQALSARLGALEEEWRTIRERLDAHVRDLASTRDLAAQLVGRRAAVSLLERAETLTRQLTDEELALLALEAELVTVTRTAHAVESHAIALRLARLEGMAAELAGDLRDGSGCPVCGSCEHPAPARRADPVTAEDIRTAEAAAAAALGDRDGVQGRLTADRATQEARRRELASLLGVPVLGDSLLGDPVLGDSLLGDPVRGDSLLGDPVLGDFLLGDRGTAALTTAVSRARREAVESRDASESLGELQVVVQQLTGEHSRLEEQAQGARDAQLTALTQADTAAGQGAAATAEVTAGLDQHRRDCPCAVGARLDLPEALPDVAAHHAGVVRSLTDLAEALRELNRAGRSAVQARQRFDAALVEQGFSDAAAVRAAALPLERLAEISDRLQQLDRARAEAETLLGQPDVIAAMAMSEPDLGTLETAWSAARETCTRAQRAHTICEGADHRVHVLRGEVETLLAQIGPAAAEQELIQEVAECVAGTSANNALRMRLSSYILAARLEEVARLANERLTPMSDGRYALEYSDALARRGARSGLGLRVRDAWTGVARETSSLSGGEAFMASLALALGLGAAVREEAGGVDLQTLFVDEGFGTLDEESLEQVMSVLDGLREGGRAVGIVSHVSELRARIPTQVHVTKSQLGSRLRVDAVGSDEPAA